MSMCVSRKSQPASSLCQEVEGLTNKVLQGPETDSAIVKDMMSNVQRGESASATIVNYKKSGEKFTNSIHVMTPSPLLQLLMTP